jgi:hypothetical protein
MSVRPPFYLDEDQAWVEDWLQHVLHVVEEDDLEPHGNLKLKFIYEDGKLVPYKLNPRTGRMFGSNMEWEETTYDLGMLRMLFWRKKDADHLQEWMARCENGLDECVLPNKKGQREVHQVMITLWVPLGSPEPCVRGKLDAGNHVPFTKFTHQVEFEFGTEDKTEDEGFFTGYNSITPEQRKKLLAEIAKRKPKPE